MKSNQNGFAMFVGVLIVLSLAAIGAGTYLYVSQTAKPKPVPAAQKTEIPPSQLAINGDEATTEAVESEKSPETKTAEVASGQTEPVDAGGWKTYHDVECGFEFKYPAGYLPEKSDKGIFFSSGVDCKDNSFCAEVEGSMSPSVHCYVAAEILRGLTFENYLSERSAKDFPIKKIVMNGDYGYEIEEMGMAGAYKSIYFLNENNLIEFSVAKEGNERGMAFIDQIALTFKFVEPRNNHCATLAEPFNKPEGGEKFDFPLNCYFDIGHGFLKWNFKVPEENEKNVVLEISDSAGKLVQKITIEDETIETDFFLDGDINVAEDINFDGYKDLRIVNARGANITGYNYWIFNPMLKRFEKDPVLENIPYPSFDGDKKTITAFHATNFGIYSTIFKFINGKYQMIEQNVE